MNLNQNDTHRHAKLDGGKDRQATTLDKEVEATEESTEEHPGYPIIRSAPKTYKKYHYTH